VSGLVDRVSIDKGVPKLHVQNPTMVLPSTAEDGNVEAGIYSYRVVWEDSKGSLFGLDFEKTIRTTGTDELDKAIVIANLPETSGPKQVYRTDNTGEGSYQLVGTILDGAQGSFVDKLASSERSSTRLQRDFQRSNVSAREYNVSLNNVSEVQPPG
jgi:hypothetical protein